MPNHLVPHNDNPVRRQSDADEMTIDFMFIWEALKNRRNLIAGITLLALLLAAVFAALQTPRYTATSVLLLNTKENILLDMEQAVLGKLDDSAAINSEIDILGSRALMQRVIERLGLLSHPEFAPGEKQESKEITMIRATDAMLERLRLSKDPRSYTVRISFTSSSPRGAERIANAIADEYLDFQIEAQGDMRKQASEWFSGRVKELRRKVVASERVVQQFTEEHGLFELDGKTLDDQQISDLNRELILARAAQTQAQARLDRVKQMREAKASMDSVQQVLDSKLIQSLREQEAELIRKRSELSSQYGAKHPKMGNINAELKDLQIKIGAEIDKIIAGMESEVEIARERAQAMSGQLDTLRWQIGDSRHYEVQLEELKRNAEADRELYESFLARMKETGESENLRQVNAKIISRADLPLNPSYPNKKIILLLSLMAGLCCGVGLALLVEHINLGFMTPAQVEDALGIPCIGMVPEIKKRHAQTVNTESLRSIIAGLQFSSPEGPPQSLLILSSLPQEGKGWLAASLGHVAATSGKKVLLIDCDMHRPVSLKLNAKKEKPAGLNDYLEGNAEIDDIIRTDSANGMDYIGSSPVTGNPQALFESGAMQQLMAKVRREYDLILIDSPPVTGMTDVLVLSRFADASLFAVQWRRTPRHVVENALRILSRAHINPAGIILTRTDFNHYRRQAFGTLRNYNLYRSYYGRKPRLTGTG